MSKSLYFTTFIALCEALNAPQHARRQATGTATVNLAQPSGEPQHLASGFIYGLRDNADGTANKEIPSDLIKGMGFNYCRAGGAQLTDALGWVAGSYEGRWNSTLSNYRTTRLYGGRFTLLMHDLWGADSKQSSTFSWPGDKGNWTEYDAFLDRVFSDIKKGNAQPGLDIDIWNEPDGSNFWGASQDQYLAMWNRTHHRLRAELSEVHITGPSPATPPTKGDAWWNNFMSYVAETDTVPDYWSWHLLSPSRTMRETKDRFDEFRIQNKLPEKPIVINEYAWVNDGEQSPAGAVFYISQLERYNSHGLRANWGSNQALHDTLANLVIRGKDGSYKPTGEWHVYKYYVQEMEGQRVATTPSADDIFEVYATHNGQSGSVKVLAAIRPIAGKRTYDLTITGLDKLGYKAGKVSVKTLRFDGPNKDTAVAGPVDLGVYSHDVKNGQITFWVTPEAVTTAYAFELIVD
ncbi:putative glycoside hydrolase family 39 protein [Fusarium austroafricanum]|uniref:Putative glycoside hydrolase family 39 protein n=1 Tax=Fusarium austroafricanum TaxID=2364996 RepID=A0A8H4KM00_9HYPO|nr:putative glycoside hydrolase family 39 protein [Fusarium austroafricanum]